MGLLKHAILPLFVVIDLTFLYKFLIAEDIALLANLWGRDLTKLPATVIELHLLRVVGGACLLLAINNIAAILVENSHYRGMAVLLHTICFGVDAYSYVISDRDPSNALALVAIGAVGLVVHSMEPGIFTKDKNDAGKKKKKRN